MAKNPESSPAEQNGFIIDSGGGWRDKTKKWLKNNSSVILSIAVIIILGGSIYAYTQTSHLPILEENQVGEQTNDTITADKQVNQNEEKKSANESNQENVKKQEKESDAKLNKKQTNENNKQEKLNVTENNSKIVSESDKFIETAKKGEGVTHLARKALKQYLNQQNSDIKLSKEHKIYIEDYLQKKVGSGVLRIGETRSFSSSLIKQAIAHAQQLTPQQLSNITPYANLVANL